MTTREERLETELRKLQAVYCNRFCADDGPDDGGKSRHTKRCHEVCEALLSKNAEKIDTSAAPPEERSNERLVELLKRGPTKMEKLARQEAERTYTLAEIESAVLTPRFGLTRVDSEDLRAALEKTDE